MSLLYQCLSADDLKDLTEEDLEMLQRIIEHELHTSTGIKRLSGNIDWQKSRFDR
jgi:hypothetical protein